MTANAFSDATPLAGLTGIVELSIGYNGLLGLGWVSQLKALKWLDLRKNQITDIGPLRNLTALTNLYLYENPVSDLAPLAGITTLELLWVQKAMISDLGPLRGLTSLNWLTLESNQITDLAPLVANPGIGTGDAVYIMYNPIDCAAQASNIQALRQRGAFVGTECS